MKTIICSIYDKATEAYMRPWTAQTEGQAVRMFEDEVLKEGTPVNAHPEDYALFRMGTFDDNKGVESEEPVCLRRAHEVHNPVTPIQAGVN